VRDNVESTGDELVVTKIVVILCVVT